MKIEETQIDVMKKVRYLDSFLASLEGLLAHLWQLVAFGESQWRWREMCANGCENTQYFKMFCENHFTSSPLPTAPIPLHPVDPEPPMFLAALVLGWKDVMDQNMDALVPGDYISEWTVYQLKITPSALVVVLVGLEAGFRDTEKLTKPFNLCFCLQS